MIDQTDYLDFLERKQKKHILSGFEVDEKDLNSNMFDFQKFIVKKALQAGKYAIFADCGLGKSLMQLEFANQVSKHTGKPVLILAPLAVSGQTINEGIRGRALYGLCNKCYARCRKCQRNYQRNKSRNQH